MPEEETSASSDPFVDERPVDAEPGDETGFAGRGADGDVVDGELLDELIDGPIVDGPIVEGEVVEGEVVEGEVVADAEASPEDLESLRAERDGLVDDLRRLQAEFANFKKRMMRDQAAVVERANESLVERLLSVLDNFELALLSLEADENVRKGVELVFADFFAVLEKSGLERIAAQGAPFDPTEHEAVLQEEGDSEPVVAEVMRAGYTLKGRVLRPAMVKVSRAGR